METAVATIASKNEIMTVDHVIAQVHLIQQVMTKVMQDGEHFGLIPGCGNKKVLFKAGAEKLCLTFRYAPSYEVAQVDHPNGHREYRVNCKITHIQSGVFQGEGVGSCSTMETKYRYRNDSTADEITDVVVPKAYWDEKNAGANPAKMKAILDSVMGGPGRYGTKKVDSAWLVVKRGEKTEAKIENPDLADQYNTVLKMAKKRALVDATITATAASDIFTQDLEETLPEKQEPAKEPAKSEAPAQKQETAEQWSMRQLGRAENLEQLDACVKALKEKGFFTDTVRARADAILEGWEAMEQELKHEHGAR